MQHSINNAPKKKKTFYSHFYTHLSANTDYQFGHTRLFLKDTQNEHLEQERSKVLAKYILVLQKAIRGWIYRRRSEQLPSSFKSTSGRADIEPDTSSNASDSDVFNQASCPASKRSSSGKCEVTSLRCKPSARDTWSGINSKWVRFIRW